MIYKYTSIKTIVDGLYRDLGIQEQVNFFDVVEWCGEALEAIGVHGQYQHITSCIDICNYRAPLPCNFHKLLQIEYKGYPLRIAPSTFNNVIPTTRPDSTDLTINGMPQEFPQLIAPVPSNVQEFTYTINDNFIYTNFEEGTINMAYVGIPVDEDNLPLIPDNYYFIKAIKAYVTYMLDYQKWRTNQISKDVYMDSKSKWDWYCGGAKGAGLMPNIDKAESIKNQWVRLLPKQNEYDSFFKNLANKERLKRH